MKLLAISCMVWASLLQADTLLVHNTSDYTLYTRPYHSFGYQERAISSSRSGVVELPPQAATRVERPGVKANIRSTRELFFSFSPDDLQDDLNQDLFLDLASVNVAIPTFTNYYVYTVEDGGKREIRASNAVSWKVIKPVAQKAQDVAGVAKQTITVLSAATTSRERYLKDAAPESTKPAMCRQGSAVSPEEKSFLRKRKLKVRATLNNLGMGVVSGKEPVIAVCASGGGVRTCVATCGSLLGLESINMLDAVTYVSSLSGSTWCVAPIINFGWTPKQYQQQLIKRLRKGLVSSSFNMTQLAHQLIRKNLFGRTLSLPDVYGGALSSLLLEVNVSKNPYTVLLSHQQKQMGSGNYPFPLYTAIVSPEPYIWVEFNPYEIGSSAIGTFIPSWALGRSFNAGATTNQIPPESLGFCLGIFGYALGVNVKEALEFAETKIKPDFIREWLRAMAASLGLLDYRLLTAHVPNFTKGLDSIVAGRRSLELIDAGIDFNLPIPPLCEPDREVDIIIILDNSDAEAGDELRKAEAYARQHKLAFPSIDYSKLAAIQENPIAIFKQEGAPTIIYLPLVKNDRYPYLDPASCPDDFCSTFNFTYDKRHIDLLTGLTSFAIRDNADLILNEIRACVQRKNSGKNDKTKPVNALRSAGK